MRIHFHRAADPYILAFAHFFHHKKIIFPT
jgi:hypothetical protein